MRELTMDEMDVVSGGEYNLIGSGWSTAWSAAGGGGTANWNLALLPGETLIDVSATRLSSPFFPNIGGSGGSDILDFGIEDPEIVVTASRTTYDWCGGSAWWANAPDWADDIYLGDACRTHDGNYGSDSAMDRSVADEKFRADIYNTMIKNGASELEAYAVSEVYYTAVRFFGLLFYKGQGFPQ